MPDPQKLLEGKGTQVRFVRIRQTGQYEDADLIWLIEAAAKTTIATRKPSTFSP